MCRAYIVCLFECFTVLALAQSNTTVAPKAYVASPSSASQGAQAKILELYGKLPLDFEENHGQTDERVKFLSRTGEYTLFLTAYEIVFCLKANSSQVPTEQIEGRVLRTKLRNANPAARITGLNKQLGTSNYFIGNDQAKWQSHVPTYAKVKYEGIYSGIDLVYYGDQRQLEYDFIVAPGADPRPIAFDVLGAKRIRLDPNGDLVFKMGEEEIRWRKPRVYQKIGGTRQPVAASYTVTDTNRVGFALAHYDARRPLYIDPLIYSTYLGGSGEDFGYGIAVDSVGNAYVTGQTFSTDFPVSSGAFQTICGGKTGSSCYNKGEAFIAKLNPQGSGLVYSTYLGGNGGDAGTGIAVDSTGNVYVTGQTYSANFPTTSGAFQRACERPCSGHGAAFVTKLNPEGSALVYSTYIGGNGPDWGGGIAVDKAGNVYVTGQASSANFPTTPGAFQTICGDAGCGFGDVFVTKLNPGGSALIYSTYLGGSGLDFGRGIAIDNAGNAYVTGGTLSTDFPITPGAFQTVCGDPDCGFGDAFVAKLDPSGSTLIYSTYLGGSSSEIGTAVTPDSGGNAYVVGGTGSPDFPTRNPIQASYGGGGDAFVAKLNTAGALIYSTFLGGSAEDNGNGIAIDNLGNVYVTGNTSSTNFPIVNSVQAANSGYSNAFAAKIRASGTLSYSTYLGGANYDIGTAIAVDDAGNAYFVGATDSSSFRTRKPLQAANRGGFDAFVAKIGTARSTTTSISSSLNPAIQGAPVTFSADVSSGNGAPPNGEEVTFMIYQKVLGTGVLSGGSASLTLSALPVGDNPIKAVYVGDSNFAGSTSQPVKQVVTK
jgi:hypothetical protein